MPFYIYAWIASFSGAFLVIAAKLTTKYSIKNPWLFNFSWILITLLFTIPAALINHAGIPNDWPPVIAAGVFFALFYIFYIFANYKLDVSVLSPLFNFKSVFTVLLSSIMINEKLSSYQLMIFAIILIAGMFANMDEKLKLNSFFKSAVGIVLLSMIFLSLNNIYINIALVKNDLWTVILWIAIVNFLVILPTIPLFYKDLGKVKVNQIAPVIAMGIFQLLYNFVANIAYGVNVGVTSIIITLPISMMIIFLLSVVWPKLLEKHTLKVYAIRFASAAIMIWGALQLSR